MRGLKGVGAGVGVTVRYSAVGVGASGTEEGGGEGEYDGQVEVVRLVTRPATYLIHTSKTAEFLAFSRRKTCQLHSKSHNNGWVCLACRGPAYQLGRNLHDTHHTTPGASISESKGIREVGG